MVLSYDSNIQRKLSLFFLFKNAICQLLALFIMTVIISRDTVLGSFCLV